jgi:predicted ester cyclase
LTDAQGNEITGIPAFKAFHENLRSAFPDIQVTVEETVSEGDLLVARCRVRATHAGNGLGIEATNRPVEFTGMSMMRIRDGRIVENWDSYDFLTMMQQVGLVNLASS